MNKTKSKASTKALSVCQTKWAEWARQSDWGKPEHYPNPGAVSWDRWAWEFLRRNPEFAAEFLALVKTDDSGEFKPGRKPSDIARYALQDKWKIDMFYISPWVENDPAKFGAPCRFKTGLADHPISTCKFTQEDGRFYVDHSSKSEDEFYIVKRSQNEFLYRVNVGWPIEPQMQAIKRHALANQDCWKQNDRPEPIKQKRHHDKKFPFYLRAYDAITDGLSSKDVADVLAIEKVGFTEKDVDNAYEAAYRYIQGEYIFIPMQPK